MTGRFKRGLCFFLAIILTVGASLVLPYISTYIPQKLKNISASGGVAVAGNYSPENDKMIYLTGEWEFYWGRQLVNGNEENGEPDLYGDVPSSWTSYRFQNGNRLPNGGTASYRMVLRGLKATVPIVVSVPNVSGAYSVYINKKLVYATGSNSPYPGEDSSMEYYIDPYDPTENQNGTYEIIIETTCGLTGGLTAPPMLCSYRYFQSYSFKAVALRYLLIGIIVFFSGIAVFFSKILGNEFNLFWLILLCVSFAVRILICNEGYVVSHNMFFDMDYEIMTMLIYVSTYVIKLALFMHVSSALRLKIPQNVMVFISALFLICAFIPYFISDWIYISVSFLWLQAVSYLPDIYLLYKLSAAVERKQRFSLLYLIAYCITVTGIVIDNFYICGEISANVSVAFPLACVVFITVTLIIQSENTSDAYKASKKTAELTKEISEINMALMLSQIQPHFLYNALNTIKYLIKKDPKSAETAVVNFSSYLRANMDSLTQKEPIMFEKELNHVRNYASIEQLRFGERLKVEYDIQSTQFKIPPLTVQPLVENAIKHGVNQRVDGGAVKIATREDKDFWYVTVSDNGVGFDSNTPSAVTKENSEHAHVGLKNISVRLREMVNAEITVASVPGEGTKAMVKIPKEITD